MGMTRQPDHTIEGSKFASAEEAIMAIIADSDKDEGVSEAFIQTRIHLLALHGRVGGFEPTNDELRATAIKGLDSDEADIVCDASVILNALAMREAEPRRGWSCASPAR